MEAEDIPGRGGAVNNDNMYGPDSLEKNIYSNSTTLLEN